MTAPIPHQVHRSPRLGRTPWLQALSTGILSLGLVCGALEPGEAVTFNNSNGTPAPQTSLGGGVRGRVQFTSPSQAAPQNSLWGGVRGRVQFAAPGQAAPQSSLGGGVRGSVRFTMPDNSTPSSSLGGGVRGAVRFKTAGATAPRQTLGGGVRNASLMEGLGWANPDTILGYSTAAIVPHALVPNAQTLAYTYADRPTFFAYMPPAPTEAVFFSIQTEAGDPVYHTFIQVPPEGGIVRLTLPEEAPALEPGVNYAWFFVPIEPGSTLQPDSPGSVAWIQRLGDRPDNLNPQGADPSLEQATALAAEGVWYDTLAVLSEGMMAQNATAGSASTPWGKEWQELLASVGLGDYGEVPLVDVQP